MSFLLHSHSNRLKSDLPIPPSPPTKTSFAQELAQKILKSIDETASILGESRKKVRAREESSETDPKAETADIFLTAPKRQQSEYSWLNDKSLWNEVDFQLYAEASEIDFDSLPELPFEVYECSEEESSVFLDLLKEESHQPAREAVAKNLIPRWKPKRYLNSDQNKDIKKKCYRCHETKKLKRSEWFPGLGGTRCGTCYRKERRLRAERLTAKCSLCLQEKCLPSYNWRWKTTENITCMTCYDLGRK